MEEIIIPIDSDKVPTSGAMSQLHWNSPTFKKVLREVFDVKSYERFLGVRIGPDGIKAYFETIK
jgi:hypothetical protein